MSLLSIASFDSILEVKTGLDVVAVYVQPRLSPDTGRYYVHISGSIARSVYDMRSHPHYDGKKRISMTYLPITAEIFWGEDPAGVERWGILKSFGNETKRHYLK